MYAELPGICRTAVEALPNGVFSVVGEGVNNLVGEGGDFSGGLRIDQLYGAPPLPYAFGVGNVVAPLFCHMGGLKRLTTFSAAEPSHVPFEGGGLRQTKHGR